MGLTVNPIAPLNAVPRGEEAESLKCDSPGQRPGIEEMRATRPGRRRRCPRTDSKRQTDPGPPGLLTDH